MHKNNEHARRAAASLSAVLTALLVLSAAAYAQTSAFTYQGKLSDGANSAPTGTYDLQFTLYNAGGAAIGALVSCSGAAAANNVCEDVSVVNGVFTVSLDFGASPFTSNAARTIEIGVRAGTSTGAFAVLAPRQAITSAPYAIQAANAATAATANGVASSAGNSVVAAINDAATTATINSNRLSSNVVLLNPPATQDAASGNTNTILNLRGNSQNLFKVNLDGGLLSTGQYDNGTSSGGIPIEGAGTRLMWYPNKAAFRAGYVSGTQWDDANVGYFSTAFGQASRASGDYSFAAGRTATAANISSVALGEGTIASGAVSVALGYGAHTNARQGSFVFADRSVPLTYNSDGTVDTANSTFFRAAGNHTFNVRASGGYYLYTNTAVSTGLQLSGAVSGNNSYGGFVWTDRSSDTAITPTAQNQTIFRSSGGFTIYTNAATSTGVTIAAGGGAWQNLSDRSAKENFAPVNSRDVLRKVLTLPITTWNYKTQAASIRHIGAMAQDFKAAFSVGEDDKHISTIDPDGVAFAAIQGLNAELNEQTARLRKQNAALQAQVAAQAAQLSEFEARLKRLEQKSAAPRRTNKRRR